MNKILKRILDFVASLIGLIMISPLLIGISIWIKFDSKGPIFFKQNRVGLNGELFQILKFRSMKVNDETDAPSPESDHDIRLTQAGKFIRKTSIDELPQLINVLLGNMSLVGPRAITEKAYQERINKYSEVKGISMEEAKRLYEVRKKVKPGMTGLTQVNGRSNAGIIAATELDYEYAQNASFAMDISILIMTLSQVLKRKGTN